MFTVYVNGDNASNFLRCAGNLGMNSAGCGHLDSFN